MTDLAANLRSLLQREVGLGPILWVALLFRLPAVVLSRGYEFLDEQFQYVDPAFHLATGLPFLQTHEWQSGIRSWVYPWLLSWPMRWAESLGLNDPASQMLMVRAVLALASLLAVYGIHQLIADRKTGRAPLWVLLFATCNGLLVYQSVHPNGLAWSCISIVFAMGLLQRNGAGRAALAGAAIGLAFCCRPQDGLYGVPVFAALLWQRRWRDAAATTGAAVAMIGVQGMVDSATWGSFLHSVVEYVRFNLQHSTQWSTQPFYYYALLVLAWSPALWIGIRWLLGGAHERPWVAAAALFSLLVHSMLDRKAARFVTSALVLGIALWSLGAWREWARQRPTGWMRVTMALAIAAHAVVWSVASAGYANRQRIETACFLAVQPDVTGIAYYGLQNTDFGGQFYLRDRAPLHALGNEEDSAERLRALIATEAPVSHLVAKASVTPTLPPGWQLERVASFSAFSSDRPHRVYVTYRLRPKG